MRMEVVEEDEEVGQRGWSTTRMERMEDGRRRTERMEDGED